MLPQVAAFTQVRVLSDYVSKRAEDLLSKESKKIREKLQIFDPVEIMRSTNCGVCRQTNTSVA